MREILFRGKRLDNGKFVEGDLSCCPNGTVRINPHEYGQPWLGYPVDPETVGQYTGLTNINGVKIFEGDIVSRFENGLETNMEKISNKLAKQPYPYNLVAAICQDEERSKTTLAMRYFGEFASYCSEKDKTEKEDE